ncbi:spermatogenesis-associated protein 31D1-like [Eptesicus fuscus]|uniref:spermatogenesis-associated protein 31D1-like n=1 Tax=Eptesicus fuscus TaxID=29078 RepID=UPI002403D107|nr:spermatogenesis-associated protein 31D1-like [Eptesicus fuscus]
MVLSEALEKSTPSVAPVAFTAPVTAPVTEPSFNQSSAFSTVPAGDLITTPLPEPSPPPPSVLSYNSMTPLGDFLSPSPPGQTLPPEPVHHSSPQPKDLFSSTLTQYDFHQGFLALHSTKTSFGADPAAKFIDPRHLLFLSPDEHDSAQQYLHPKSWEDHLKQKLTQLFWGLPSLHSESLSSAVHASGDYSIFFNSISNAFTGQESPGLPYLLPPSLPEVEPQPLPQSQHLHLTQIQPQAHLQSPLPILPSSPITQNKICEVYFHRPKNESECLTSSETEHLECNVLQKEQESLWGLTSVVQSSKAHVATSFDPVEFPISSEFREEFEHHLRKRLIQPYKNQPCRTHGSLSLMKPLSNCSGIPESKSSSGLSWVSVDKDQSSENPNVGLSQPGSSYERSSERFQLVENKGKDEGHSQENDPKVHLLSDSKTSSGKDVGSGSEVKSLSRENSMFSEYSVTLENVWKVHLKKTFEKISEGKLPGTMHSSQPSIKQNPVKSHPELEQRSLPSSVGGDYRLDTSQELPLLECAAQQMQKSHIPKFQMRMSGLPTKVFESKERFKSKDTSSHSSINPNSSSSTKQISKVNTKSGAFMPLRGSSGSLLGDKVGIESSADDLNFPLPATSLVGKKGHSPADIQRTLSEEIQKFLKTKLPVTNTISDKKSQIHSLMANIQPPKMPARRAGTRQETKNNSVNSNDRAEIQQGANREKSEPAFISTMSRETVRAEGLNALQPETSGVLTTSKPGISQRINRETTVTTENAPSILSVQAPDLSELKTQVMAELKLKLEKKYSQAQGPPRDMSHDSDSLTYRASPTPAQDVSSADAGVPQVLHVHSKDSTVSMEKQQEPWLPRHPLRSCQDQNFPPAVKKDIMRPPPKPTGSKSVELGGGDARVRISQPGGKRFPSQDTVLEDMHGSKSPQTLSQKGQVPPPLPPSSLVGKADSHFLSKMKSFFQRLQPGIKWKMPESPQEKGIPLSSAQSRGPVKSTAAFTGTAHVMSNIGKFSKEKLGCQHAGVTTCPQEPLPSAAQSGKPVQKGAVQAQAEPGQGSPFHRRTPSYEVTNAMSGRHAAILAGQGSTCSRHTRNEDKHPENVVTLKPQQICQKHPQSVPLRGTVPHPSPTCRPQAAKRPPAVLTTAGGTVFRDQPPRFRHTMLLQNFQGKTFPAPK